MKQLNRREFVRASMVGFGAAIVSSGLTSCGSGGGSAQSDPISTSFDHGVASGDPLSDRVILWTKITVGNNAEATVSWEVFQVDTNTLVVSGSTTVTADTGHTLKIDAIGLLPDTTYRYRFASNGVTSAEGLTRTLPEGTGIERAKFAVVSCSNYPAGYFHVYSAIAARNDLNAVLHLGDYIYEHGEGGFATERAEELGRTFADNNNSENLSLEDYRNRYALYRTDTDLQACHQSHPFIAVWDDHEIADNAYKDNALNHQDGEGDYEQRKLDALQAYFEWMPIRPSDFVSDSTGEFRSYRRFQFGDLVDLFMLDTRIEGRDVQLDIFDYFVNGVLDEVAFEAALSDETRTMLGETQLQWLTSELMGSQSTWQVLGQQVLMGRMPMPPAILLRTLSVTDYVAIERAAALAEQEIAGAPPLTNEEMTFLEANRDLLTENNLALIQLPKIPFNFDSWDGYGVERDAILDIAKSLNLNLVVLAGDTHNAWANNLKTSDGQSVGVEFAAPSITSPGLESVLEISSREDAPNNESGIVSLIEDLQYLNMYDRGLLLVEFTTEQATAEWIFVDSVYESSYSTVDSRTVSFRALASASGPQLESLI